MKKRGPLRSSMVLYGPDSDIAGVASTYLQEQSPGPGNWPGRLAWTHRKTSADRNCSTFQGQSPWHSQLSQLSHLSSHLMGYIRFQIWGRTVENWLSSKDSPRPLSPAWLRCVAVVSAPSLGCCRPVPQARSLGTAGLRLLFPLPASASSPYI